MAVGQHTPLRRAVASTHWLAAAVLIIGLTGVAIDLAAVVTARTQLQVAADAAALAAIQTLDRPKAQMLATAQRYAAEHVVGQRLVALADRDVQYGVWDSTLRCFTATSQPGNAVRVTARSDVDTSGKLEPCFLRLLGFSSYTARSSAVALATARDIAFVVDLSSVHHDDPRTLQVLYDDLGFGAYPGAMRRFEQTSDVVPSAAVRSRWIRELMPSAKPLPDDDRNDAYWTAYFNYATAPGDAPLPGLALPDTLRGQIGYRTYVAFLLACGRDMKPDHVRYTPLSQYSSACVWREEDTAGGRLAFPPREQPLHAVRRSLIAVLETLKHRNAAIAPGYLKDWVSIVTFDTLLNGGPTLPQQLTPDYDAAARICARLQTCGRCGPDSAVEAGLLMARKHLQTSALGGQGRAAAQKVVVLLTAGRPELYVSTTTAVDAQRRMRADIRWYGGSRYAQDAALMQAGLMQADGWLVCAAGIGPGSDDGFLARITGQSRDDGGPLAGPRFTGGPADWEVQLTRFCNAVLGRPKTRLAQ